jgi:transglutaminase-like putative cysteine protease
MFRTAKIPARYVHGTCKFSSGSTYGHVWVQVLINGKWTIADATSSKNSLGSVANWNTKSFSLKGIYSSLSF